MKKLVLALALLPLLAVLAAPACSDAPDDHPCTGVPEGGCPLSHGVACEDPTCVAAYACQQGNVWVLDHLCPVHDAGPIPDAAPEAAPPPVHDASIDAPPGAFGGPGCDMLEAPDCTLGFALSCPSGCCDCEDLYVCQSGGWQIWGSCSLDAGILENH